MRAFNLKKIKNIKITDEFFTQIIGKDIKEFKKDMLGPWKGKNKFWVSIFYDKEVANHIREKHFPQEHKIKNFGDGSLRLKIRVSSPEAVLFYLVLPYHYHAEVEAPLKKTLKKYKIKK